MQTGQKQLHTQENVILGVKYVILDTFFLPDFEDKTMTDRTE